MIPFCFNEYKRYVNETDEVFTCFMLCEILRKNEVHLCDEKIIVGTEEMRFSKQNLVYLLDKIIYLSHKRHGKKLPQRLVDVAWLVSENLVIYTNELSNNDCLAEMLAA